MAMNMQGTKSIRPCIGTRTLGRLASLIAVVAVMVTSSQIAVAVQTETAPETRSDDRLTNTADESSRASAENLPSGGPTPAIRRAELSEPPNTTPDLRDNFLPPGELNALEQGEIDEIMAIRERLGGGIAGQLEGLGSDGRADPRLNAEQPRDVTRQMLELEMLRDRTRLVDENVTTQRDSYPTRHQRRDPDDRQLRDPWSAEQPWESRGERPMGESALARQQSMRIAARLAEEAAAELEEVGVYDQADQIRSAANALWIRARSMGDR